MRKIVRVLMVGVIFAFLLPISCARKGLNISQLEFESTPVISSSEMWGVVKELYLPVPAERDSDEEIVITLRKGDITRILRTERIDDLIWCEIEYDPAGGETLHGWVTENVFTVYDSLSKAQEGSKDLTAD